EQVSEADQERRRCDRDRVRPDRRPDRRCRDCRHAEHRRPTGHDLQQRFEPP
ncbi:MAG: Flp pilus assembly protein, pilin Flp, partial [uncultured Sphingomonas sp.]